MAGLLLGAVGGAVLGTGLWLLAWTVTCQLRARTALSSRTGTLVPRQRLGRLGVVLTVGVLVWALTSWPVAGLLAAAGTWWLPTLVGPDREHTAQVDRVEAVASWTEQVRDLMAGAAGLHQAIATTVPIAPAVIRDDVDVLATQLQQGVPPQQALQEFADRVHAPTSDLVAAALSSAATRQAADLGTLLTSLAQAARDQAAMLVRLAATRARIRTSARIVTAVTLGMAAGLFVLNADYLNAYDTGLGQLVLLGIGGLWALGLLWLKRLTRTDLGPRVLVPERTQVGL